jgi:hypothetical protein
VKVPVVAKVTEKVLPGLTVPESQRPGVSEVVVCGVDVVALVHWTVIPTGMLIGSGWNAKSTIDTACVAAGASLAVDFPSPKIANVTVAMASETPTRRAWRSRISPTPSSQL